MIKQKKRKPNMKKIFKRLDSELEKWKEHCNRCGYRECVQQLETLQFIRYGRNPK